MLIYPFVLLLSAWDFTSLLMPLQINVSMIIKRKVKTVFHRNTEDSLRIEPASNWLLLSVCLSSLIYPDSFWCLVGQTFFLWKDYSLSLWVILIKIQFKSTPYAWKKHLPCFPHLRTWAENMSIFPVIKVLRLCEVKIASEDNFPHILENYGFKNATFRKQHWCLLRGPDATTSFCMT